MCNKKIPRSVVERIPLYLNYLNQLVNLDVKMVSSKMMATDLNLGEVQVRKDLNLISGNGKPKIGYVTEELKTDLERLVRTDDVTNVIVVGAGKIGEALVKYQGFKDQGFKIIGIFDNDKNKIGKAFGDLQVQSIDNVQKFCMENNVKIGVLAVSSDSAKEVCQLIAGSGIKGILNFTNQKLDVDEKINVKNVDITSLLTMLAVEINNN
ncbi:MAG: redox-sensing transcriptional repressor Rex [Bacilli bacterium]|nr:redox-sensing transcriptional repressor Rex [Mollicutes bacterium]MDY3899777.1 redox-sensing transcriptional repressor Rex [Bacilli bacterium]